MSKSAVGVAYRLHLVLNWKKDTGEATGWSKVKKKKMHRSDSVAEEVVVEGNRRNVGKMV